MDHSPIRQTFELGKFISTAGKSIIPEPTARSAVPGVSPGRGLLIPHGYLHPGKCEHSEVVAMMSQPAPGSQLQVREPGASSSYNFKLELERLVSKQTAFAA